MKSVLDNLCKNCPLDESCTAGCDTRNRVLDIYIDTLRSDIKELQAKEEKYQKEYIRLTGQRFE